MLIRNIKEFLNLTMNKRIISLDIGKSKIGSAISDQKHLIVTPLFVFSKKNLYSELFKIIKEFNPGAILVGLPLFESEKKNKSCQMIEDITNQQAIKRRGTPEEQAAAIAVLASEDASFITGDNINCSGGQS